MKSFARFLIATALLMLTTMAAEPKNITIDETAKLLAKNTNVVVLDVRTAKEFEAGHIKGATNINFQDKDFAERVAKLDKSKTYVIHCAAGGRSGKACAQIKDMNFQNMLHMNEGFNAWTKAGKPVEK
jgi:phage shock protein E